MKHTQTYALLALITTIFIGSPMFGWGQQEKTTDPPELYTNVYVVPPNFLDQGGGSGAGPSQFPQDPFANPEKAGSPQPIAKEVLESYGISFGEGAAATFNRETSQLIVRQTRDQMELVEALIDSLDSEPEKQIHLVYQIIDSKRPLFT
ncbi:MAG: hypothetical protein KDN20_08940, partial [Verrucomicrobiae bacterium]|nr:hypothetical protein [Verrucomicrobiae bacterium]